MTRNVVWEGSTKAMASESEFTEIHPLDNKFYQAATAELIHQLLSPNTY